MDVKQLLLRLKNSLEGRSTFSKKKTEPKDAVLNLIEVILMLRDEIEELKRRIHKIEGQPDYHSRIVDLENAFQKMKQNTGRERRYR